MKKILFVLIAVFIMSAPAYAVEEDVNLLENEGYSNYYFLEEIMDKLVEENVISSNGEGVFDIDKNGTSDIFVDEEYVSVEEDNSVTDKVIIEIPQNIKEYIYDTYEETIDSIRFRFDECKVTFHPENGEEDTIAYVKRGQSIGQPTNPKSVNAEFSKWVNEENEPFIFSRKINTDTELYAKWSYFISICSYDDSEQKPAQGGSFYDHRYYSYGGNNYMVNEGETITLRAYPDNGYKFVGWYNGRYIGGSTQTSEPYINSSNLISTDPELEIEVYDSEVICPVFKKASLINFVDIGNIWTDLDAAHVIPFTGEINPNEEGLSNFIEISNEKWTDEYFNEISLKNPKKPIGRRKYSHSISIRAKEKYTFSSEFRFIFGGTEYSWDEIEDMVEFSDDDKEITIYGLVNDQIAKELKNNTLEVKTKNLKLKYSKKTRKKKVVTAKNAVGDVTIKKLSGNKKISINNNGKVTIKGKIKRGKYKIKVKITANGNEFYKAKTIVKSFKVIIK